MPTPSDDEADALDKALAAGAALSARLAALPSLPDRAAQRQALLQLPAELRAIDLALARLEAAGAEASTSDGDALTGLADRARLDAASTALALQFPDSPLMVIAVDVDHLHHVNDTWSRATGDAVLRAVAGVLRAQSRPQDVLARAGGDLFVVALGGPVSTTRALLVAERLRAAIEAHAWAGLGDALRVTASIGVAARAPGESLDDALARAGAALQECKRGGRNQVRSRA
ncbi:GGDEF domain-containing protein [Scleromatobacter humisilvae]|uniref:diguanylate cyclase n=1 Tax=Scleromatobacter humisilvae TaxID=2897159 RepID=A0A9X2C180_9BURK|nr:GGDEF domain-containing protein [Scleromatobacter humisilvae]MCK9685519.1 GGDEF domain-containing protein [Scleromatobacter humisilvae]